MTHLGTPHDAYDYIEQIGDGSFGTVHKAMNKISHKLVKSLSSFILFIHQKHSNRSIVSLGSSQSHEKEIQFD